MNDSVKPSSFSWDVLAVAIELQQLRDSGFNGQVCINFTPEGPVYDMNINRRLILKKPPGLGK